MGGDQSLERTYQEGPGCEALSTVPAGCTPGPVATSARTSLYTRATWPTLSTLSSLKGRLLDSMIRWVGWWWFWGQETFALCHLRTPRKVYDGQSHPGPHRLASLRRPALFFLCSFSYVFVSGARSAPGVPPILLSSLAVSSYHFPRLEALVRLTGHSDSVGRQLS